MKLKWRRASPNCPAEREEGGEGGGGAEHGIVGRNDPKLTDRLKGSHTSFPSVVQPTLITGGGGEVGGA